MTDTENLNAAPRFETAQPFWQRGKIRAEVFWLYVVQGAAAVMPLLLIYHVGRIVGPVQWGRLALAEAIGRYLQVVVEYGFQVSGSRDAAVAKDSRQQLGQLLAKTLSAQVLLAAICLGPALFLGTHLGLGSASRLLIASALVWGTAQAMNLSWFYQATGQIRRFAVFDLIMRAITVTCVCLLVSHPEQAWRVLGIQAVGSILTFLLTFRLVAHQTGFKLPGISSVWTTIHQGFALFSFRAAGMLYISLNVVILSFYVSSAQVGVFAAAERICRLAIYGLAPLNTVFYVRIAHLESINREAATRLAHKAVRIVGACAIAAGLFLGAAGPVITRVLFGAQFAASGNLTRWFGVVVTFATLNTILGGAWLLPRRKDRVLSLGAMVAGVVNVVLASILARRFGGSGMVFSLVVCELIIFAIYWRQLARMRVKVFAALHSRQSQTPSISETIGILT